MNRIAHQLLLAALIPAFGLPPARAAEPADPASLANAVPAERDARTSAAREFHVAPGGSDADAGTQDKPFTTVAGARDAIRVLKEKSGLPRGYLTNHRNALDKLGEWHWQDNTLHLWPPDGKDPSPHRVEAKKRHLAFDLRGREYVTLKGLRIFASSVTMYNANHCVVDGCRMSFVSHYTWFDDNRDGYIDDFRGTTMIRKKSCGTAAKAGGNRENKPRPTVMGVPCLLTTRREFVERMGVAGAALGLAGATAAAGAEPPRDAAGNVIPGFEKGQDDPGAAKGWQPVSDRRIRVGIAGYGHGGSHGHLTHNFIESILLDRKPIVHIGDALNMTLVGVIAHKPALKGGEWMKIPQYDL